MAALIRRTQDAGGFAAVLARGHDGAGAILAVAVGRETTRLLEAAPELPGAPPIVDVTPADARPQVVEDYWRRRRARDPDLWVVELDSPHAERFVAEILSSN